MSRELELTALQEHVLRYLASNAFADPPDGPRLKAGATVREISAASHGRYDPRQVTQCVRSLAKATTGNADHLPRRAWTRAINPTGGSTKGDDAQWVATPAGRYMTGVRSLADRAIASFIEDLALGAVSAVFADEHRGLFRYTLTLGDATVVIVMPGRPLAEVRWIDLPGQGVWTSWPSVKVDGRGRPWLMAIRDATSALTGVDFTSVEPIRKRLRRQAAAAAAAGIRERPEGTPGGGGRRASVPGSSPPQWPALPVPGELVQVPLPLPDMLLSAVGYDGGARYVALRWSGGSGGDVLWTDGAMTTTGWWPPWRLLIREHVLGRAMFASYDLGDLHEDPGVPAPHWLLADRWEHTLHVGLARDVQQLLATQPSTTSAVADAVGPERLLELLQQQMQAMPVPSPDVVRAAIDRRAADHQALQRWLDDALAQINPAPA